VDALLGAQEALLAKKRDLKAAAMQQLLTGETRLPGFSGEWEVKRFGEVLRFQVGFPFSSTFFNEKDQGIRLVKNRDLKSDDQVFHYCGPYESGFLVKNGDILIGMDGDFLPCLWAKGPALLNQRVGRIVPLEGLNLQFAYYYLMAPLKQIELMTASTTVKHLSHGDIEGIKKRLPPLTEQTAIAAVLSDMDAEIAALEAQRDKTRALKQGMMQELLTGRIRLL
jgi:type I restriction enzyme S subunit